jgi:hypothetical protein
MRTPRAKRLRVTLRAGKRMSEAERAAKKRKREEDKAAKARAKEESKAAKLKEKEKKKEEMKANSASEKKKQEDIRLLDILTSNIEKSCQTDTNILESQTFQGYPETVRNDIHMLTDNDRVVAPMKVTIAGVLGRIAYPTWDTRKHQVGIGGEKSLRSFDHSFVANNLHRLGLYRTATEGILTRSFELKHPFTMNYPGEINPTNSKLAFLRLINRVNEDPSPAVAETILRYFFHRLQLSKGKVDILARETLSSDRPISLEALRNLLTDIFDLGAGMSASPAIVVHTAFSVAQPFLWNDVEMTPLKRHTASDSTSRAIGDVEAYRKESPFLSVEIKHKLQIDSTMIRTFSQKTGAVPMRYMLTTAAIRTKYTDDNILIGNVTDVTLHTLHSVLYREPTIPMTFAIRLREALIGSPDISATNKAKISELFTKHAAAPSPE